MDVIEKFTKIISETAGRDLNEADTRHRIIDFVLHDLLSWPRNMVSLEEYINPGFADYILKKQNGDEIIVVEAKKEGVFFELPMGFNGEKSDYVQIKKLLSNDELKSAMEQVRSYCQESGCEYACVTNGHEWVFFKVFEKGKRWDSLSAFVVRSSEFFVDDYTKAINNISYRAIIDNMSLASFLSSTLPKDRGIYFPKDKIPAYAHQINSNKLASNLRPIVNAYFGIIDDSKTDFMERCYVSQRDYRGTFDGMRVLIQDSLSPYFEQYQVQQLNDTGKGGQVGGRITKNLKAKKSGEVLVLFGGKGSGKSTFLKRLLHHNAPRWLRDYAVISLIDLLKVPESVDVVRGNIWSNLVLNLDEDKVLDFERNKLIETLFSDKFLIAKGQELAGLSPTSETYNLKLNELVREWKSDNIYCAKRLVGYWENKGKGVIVVVDNTDQYSSDVQDFCFTSAQEISNLLNCTVLISMREERFYNSKIHGVLDAFQNSGFHISSPRPADVFQKRLDYVVGLLANDVKRSVLFGDLDDDFVKDATIYLNILSRDFNKDSSPLNNFLTACAHGDIRLSLDLFRSFLLSGYTNVEQMISARTWNFMLHQVIKPVMIPKRYFYDESLSDIPNIYQLRSSRHASHFTALRILRKLSKNVEINTPSYYSVSELKAYFVETFNMLEDFEKNLDVLLKHGFVEANNRLDCYSGEVDSVKITNYGLYMIDELAYHFTYLDLICTDCGVYDEQTSNYLVEAAKKEYGLFNRSERFERVKVRLERAHVFINYLCKEEERERAFYSLGMPAEEMFTYKSSANFSEERTRITASALKQKS